jgi:hypothetical protein
VTHIEKLFGPRVPFVVSEIVTVAPLAPAVELPATMLSAKRPGMKAETVLIC